CVAGPSCGVAPGADSCPGAGGLCCARPGVITAAAAMMLSAALSALKCKGMRKILLADKPPRSLVYGQETTCKPHQRGQFATQSSVIFRCRRRACPGALHVRRAARNMLQASRENSPLLPRLLRRPYRLVGTRHAQHAGIVEAAADDLQSNRHSI